MYFVRTGVDFFFVLQSVQAIFFLLDEKNDFFVHVLDKNLEWILKSTSLFVYVLDMCSFYV